MASITIKGLPPELHRLLKQQAEEHGRSLNQEIIFRLRATTHPSREALEARNTESLRQQAQAGIWITEEEINRRKNEGRP